MTTINTTQADANTTNDQKNQLISSQDLVSQPGPTPEEINAQKSKVNDSEASADRTSNINIVLLIAYAALTGAIAFMAFCGNQKNNKLRQEEGLLNNLVIAKVRADADVEINNAKASASAADKKAGDANKAAGDANEEAGKLKVRARDLEMQAADLTAENLATATRLQEQAGLLSAQQEQTARAQREVLELQTRIQPRRLIDEQAAELLSGLQGAPKGRISVNCMYGDAESCALGAQIVGILKEAGWTIDDFSSPIGFGANPKPPEGIIVLIQDVKKPAASSNALLFGLYGIGFPAIGNENKNLPTDAMQLIIGVKSIENKKRTLTASPKTNFLKAIGAIPKRKIYLTAVEGDSEALAFKNEIEALLNEAGIPSEPWAHEKPKVSPIGLCFLAKSPPLITDLMAVFDALEGPVFVKPQPSLSDAEIVLVVGHKPFP